MNYEDFFNFKPTTKEMAAAILGVFVFLLIVFSTGYLLGLRNAKGGDVSDNRNGIGTAGEQLSTATEYQHQITNGIDSAKEGAARIEGGIQQISTSAEHAAAAVTDAGSLISDCQQIIGNIRNRGKTDSPTH